MMSIHQCWTLAVSLWLALSPSGGRAAPSAALRREALTLDQAIDLALRNNRGIKPVRPINPHQEQYISFDRAVRADRRTELATRIRSHEEHEEKEPGKVTDGTAEQPGHPPATMPLPMEAVPDAVDARM